MTPNNLTGISLLLFGNTLGGEEWSGAAGELSSREFKRRAGQSPIKHDIDAADKGPTQ